MAKPTTVVQDGLTAPPTSSSPPDALTTLGRRTPAHPPPSLDGGIFSVPEDFSNDPHILMARSVLNIGKVAAERSLALSVAVLADETVPIMGRHLVVRDRVYEATRGPLAKLQDASEKISERIDKLTDTLNGPPPATASIAAFGVQEARAVLRSIHPQERNRIIREAIDTNDPVTLRAISRCPAYVVGLTPVEQQNFLQQWGVKYEPNAYALREALKVALEAVERGGRLLLQFGTSLSNSKLTEQAEKLRSRAQSAIKEATGAGVE